MISNPIQSSLEQDRARLNREIQAELEKQNLYIEVNPDHSDLAEKSLQQDISAERLRYLKRKLKQVEAALKRLNEGTYGICSKCGNPIDPERMKAMPQATLCVQCKKRQERVR